MVKHYSIFEAKTHLSELLRYVKQGVEVIVTERGTPVAKVIRMEPEKNLASRLDNLKKQGNIIQRKGSFWPKFEKVKGALERFLRDRE